MTKNAVAMKAGAVLAIALMVVPMSALAQTSGRGNGANQANPFANVPVSGTADDGEAFTGTLTVQRFEAVNNGIVAVGELSGKIGNRPVNHQSVALPLQLPGSETGAIERKPDASPARWQPDAAGAGVKVIPAQVSCDVLNLVLGPVSLNLLGLNVDLNQVVLNITAVPTGGLLGTLLCAVANLLSPLGDLLALVQALNNLINFFGGLIP